MFGYRATQHGDMSLIILVPCEKQPAECPFSLATPEGDPVFPIYVTILSALSYFSSGWLKERKGRADPSVVAGWTEKGRKMEKTEFCFSYRSLLFRCSVRSPASAPGSPASALHLWAQTQLGWDICGLFTSLPPFTVRCPVLQPWSACFKWQRGGRWEKW